MARRLEPFFYKRRITDLLKVERVVYQRELARRIGLRVGQTAIWVAKQMAKDGEIEMSGIERVAKLKMRFLWLPDTDSYTVRRVMQYKKRLLLDHLRYSTVQEQFGPKLAIASLKVLSDSNDLPLNPETIKGPIKKWVGPNREWVRNEVSVGRGDIDVIALENNMEVLWLGEVKMRSDILTKVRAEHFLNVAKNFRDRIEEEKGIYYQLIIFFLAPLASESTKKWCNENNVNLILCEYAYYPSDAPKMGHLREFYEEYRDVMGVRNLVIISYPSPNALPIENVTNRMKELSKAIITK